MSAEDSIVNKTAFAEDVDLQAFLLDGRGGCQVLDREAIDLWRPGQGVLWVDVDLSREEQRHWARSLAGLESVVGEALVALDTRPRAVPVGEGLLLALRGINHHEGADPDDMVAVRLWVDKDRIVTSHRRHIYSIEDLRQELMAGRGPCDAGEFLVLIFDQLVHRMTDTVDDFEEQIAAIEDQVLTGPKSELREQLATLRRQTIAIRRYLAPQRDALSRLLVEKVGWLGEEQRLLLREVGDRLLRHIEDLDTVRERAVVTHEEMISRLSEQINSRIYVMSILAALYLPLTFLTGLLGVNIGGIPGAGNPRAFVLFLGLLAIIAIGQIFLFRLKRWM